MTDLFQGSRQPLPYGRESNPCCPYAKHPPWSISNVMYERWKANAGFTERSVVQQCLLLGEEVGELFKAVRKHEKMRTATTSVTGTVDEELADVLIYICAIANRLNVDLEGALRRKEELNETRSWA